MKKMKKLASILLAAIMVLAMAVPSMAAEDTSTGSITVKNEVEGHTFKVYQIFIGDVSDGKLSNIDWGSGLTDDGKTVMTETYGSATASEKNPLADLAEKITDAVTLAELLETKDSNYLQNGVAMTYVPADGDTAAYYTLGNLATGYYLVVDETNSSVSDHYDVYSSYIVRLVGTDVEVAPKSDKPSVDKQVEDESVASDDSENGWGESADHDINETFQFKLTATLPVNENFNFYESYQMIFNDVMSEGVTYDGGVEVQVYKLDGDTKGDPIGDPLTLSTDYTVATDTAGIDAGIDAGDYAGGTTLTVTILDLTKNIESGKLGDGYFIEVTYNAHLNENAKVAKPQEGGAAAYTNEANLNKVNLQYSNNPNVGGSGDYGKTPDDTVYVFTYELPSTKYQNDAHTPLEGAGFTLYKKDGETAIALIKNADGTYTVADQSKVEGALSGDAAKAAEATAIVTEMFSAANTGKFDVKGLDVGTYVLKETTTPKGFNTCDDITVVVTATHKEGAIDGSSEVTVHMSTTQNKQIHADIKDNGVINKSGVELPETGGIGTTIFYVLGSILVLGAVILLVTKRRMNVEK